MSSRIKSSKVKEVEKVNINNAGHIIEEEEEEEIKSSKSFDVSKYTIGSTQHEVVLEIGPDKDELAITVQDLSWSRRNQIVSKCVAWDNVGNTNFDGDAYIRQCLKEMIVDAPWGKTTEAFLVRINTELGRALETLVPSAIETIDEKAVDDLKKGL